MKKIIVITFLLNFLGCSNKPISSEPRCQKLESELVQLKQEKSLNLAGKVGNLIVNGYPYGEDGDRLNQKIKVLELKFRECNDTSD